MRARSKWQANWQLRFPDDAKTAVLNPQLATIPDLGRSFAMVLLSLLASALMPSDAAIMKAAFSTVSDYLVHRRGRQASRRHHAERRPRQPAVFQNRMHHAVERGAPGENRLRRTTARGI
jgi:hypothetical protein